MLRNMNYARLICRDLLIYWKTVVIVLTPILFLPLIICVGTQEAKCGYVVIVMAVYWVAEVLPLPVTAFFPIFLFPLLGVLDVKIVCMNYLKETNFLFFGGLIVAVAVEEANLHKRIALRVMILMGSQPRWLLFGFMFTTAFLSMWLSNTATTAMMLPIAYAVTDELLKHGKQQRSESIGLLPSSQTAKLAERSTSSGETANAVVLNSKKRFVVDNPEAAEALFAEQDDVVPEWNTVPKHEQNVCKMLLISLCYASNIGGTATLTGTGPNLVLMGILQTMYKGADTGITFASWLEFAFPTMLLMLFLSWISLQVFFLGTRSLTCRKGKVSDNTIATVLRRKYDELGIMTFAEKSVLFWFCILVLLWISRSPEFISGWSDLFKKGYVSDSVAAMLISCVLFCWPDEKPDFLCWRPDPLKKPRKRGTLMTWSLMQKKFPWNIVILLGGKLVPISSLGGFAMADGVSKSGLSDLLAVSLAGLETWPAIALLIICLVAVVFITEVTSNTATASIFIPLGLTVAESICANPLYLALPITLGASYAFMLPVATPPNAIVFSSGKIRVIDMMLAGLTQNFICIAVTLFAMHTYVHWILGLGKFPTWATEHANITCT